MKENKGAGMGMKGQQRAVVQEASSVLYQPHAHRYQTRQRQGASS